MPGEKATGESDVNSNATLFLSHGSTSPNASIADQHHQDQSAVGMTAEDCSKPLQPTAAQSAVLSKADSAGTVAAAQARPYTQSALPVSSTLQPTLADEASCQNDAKSSQLVMGVPSHADASGSGSAESAEAAAGAHAADASACAEQTPEGISNSAGAENDVDGLFARWHGVSSPAQAPAAKKPAHNR